MHSGVFIVFCGALVLAKTFPTLIYNPTTGDVDEIEFRDNYQRPEFTPSPCLRSHNGEVKCFDYNQVLEDIPDTPEYSALPSYPIEVAGMQQEQEQSSIYEPNIENIEFPAATEFLPLHPKYPNIYNYESSPIHTYIHGLIPQDSTYFYGDVYPSGHSPFNRLARRTNSYEEFLAQLSHDAQMNNILPTMSFVRTAGNYYIPYGNAPIQASFPQAVSGCARPLLFSCSPTIYRGVLAHNGYQYAPKVHVAPTSYKESLQNHKVTHDNVKSPVSKNMKNHEVSKNSVSDNYLSN